MLHQVSLLNAAIAAVFALVGFGVKVDSNVCLRILELREGPIADRAGQSLVQASRLFLEDKITAKEVSKVVFFIIVFLNSLVRIF